MKNILIIDNYDSFTYNLVHLVNELGLQCEVWRNDQFKLEDVDKFSHIILSPGPGIPSEAGLLLAVIEKYAPTKSMFGVCLGQQAIAEVFGGKALQPATTHARYCHTNKSNGYERAAFCRLA
jgi:anthranilate synthase component 2